MYDDIPLEDLEDIAAEALDEASFKGTFSKALHYYKHLLRRDDTNPLYYEQLIQLALSEDKATMPGIRRLANKLYGMDTQDIDNLRLCAEVEAENHEYDSACTILDRALFIAPNNFDVLNEYGNYHFRKAIQAREEDEDFEEVQRLEDTAIGISLGVIGRTDDVSYKASALSNIVAYFSELEEHNNTFNYAKRGLEIDPENYFFISAAGLSLQYLKRFDEAIELLSNLPKGNEDETIERIIEGCKKKMILKESALRQPEKILRRAHLSVVQ